MIDHYVFIQSLLVILHTIKIHGMIIFFGLLLFLLFNTDQAPMWWGSSSHFATYMFLFRLLKGYRHNCNLLQFHILDINHFKFFARVCCRLRVFWSDITIFPWTLHILMPPGRFLAIIFVRIYGLQAVCNWTSFIFGVNVAKLDTTMTAVTLARH